MTLDSIRAFLDIENGEVILLLVQFHLKDIASYGPIEYSWVTQGNCPTHQERAFPERLGFQSPGLPNRFSKFKQMKNVLQTISKKESVTMSKKSGICDRPYLLKQEEEFANTFPLYMTGKSPTKSCWSNCSRFNQIRRITDRYSGQMRFLCLP